MKKSTKKLLIYGSIVLFIILLVGYIVFIINSSHSQTYLTSLGSVTVSTFSKFNIFKMSQAAFFKESQSMLGNSVTIFADFTMTPNENVSNIGNIDLIIMNQKDTPFLPWPYSKPIWGLPNVSYTVIGITNLFQEKNYGTIQIIFTPLEVGYYAGTMHSFYNDGSSRLYERPYNEVLVISNGSIINATIPPGTNFICEQNSIKCSENNEILKCSFDGMKWNIETTCQSGSQCYIDEIGNPSCKLIPPIIIPEKDYSLYYTIGAWVVVALFLLLIIFIIRKVMKGGKK